VLIRSWNLFHGNAVPPQRTAFLDEMVRLATADDPDVLCLQEIPAWALRRFTVGDLAARPRLVSAKLGRVLTEPNHGRLRSAFTGQGNAIQLSARLRLLDHSVLTLNPRRFRDREARVLGLGARARLAWAKERRIVQAVRVARPEGGTVVVANLHCTSYAGDDRIAGAELRRAAWFAVSAASPGEPVVLAGDFNARPAELSTPEWGFSQPGPGIDHILVKGAESTPLRVWPDDRRRLEGRLLSDHAPVEVDVT
jgi:endonuclease/exonuclease/phosphatase family metal-dependent hydrolase